MAEVVDRTLYWDPIDRGSPHMFTAAGMLRLIDSTNDTLTHFVGMRDAAVASVTFLMSGLLVGLLGVARLNSHLVAEIPRLVKVSLGSVVLGWLAARFLAILVEWPRVGTKYSQKLTSQTNTRLGVTTMQTTLTTLANVLTTKQSGTDTRLPGVR